MYYHCIWTESMLPCISLNRSWLTVSVNCKYLSKGIETLILNFYTYVSKRQMPTNSFGKPSELKLHCFCLYYAHLVTRTLSTFIYFDILMILSFRFSLVSKASYFYQKNWVEKESQQSIIMTFLSVFFYTIYNFIFTLIENDIEGATVLSTRGM